MRIRRRPADLQITVNRKKGFYLPGEVVRARVTLTAHKTFAIERGWVALRALQSYVTTTRGYTPGYTYYENPRKAIVDSYYRETAGWTVPGSYGFYSTSIDNKQWASVVADFLSQPCEIPAGSIQTFDAQFRFGDNPGWATYISKDLKNRWEVYAALQRGGRELVFAALPVNLLRPPNLDELNTPATVEKITSDNHKITVRLPHSAYRLGTVVSGTVEVTFGKRVKTRELEVSLLRTGTSPHKSQTFRFNPRAARNNTWVFPFSFALPVEWHLPTLNAGRLCVAWEVRAILDTYTCTPAVSVPFTAYNYTPR